MSDIFDDFGHFMDVVMVVVGVALFLVIISPFLVVFGLPFLVVRLIKHIKRKRKERANLWQA
jgi:hypothetical protein